MIKLAAWTRTHAIKVANALPPFHWMKGYFFTHIDYANNQATLEQNLHEVLTREYFLQLFGEVRGKRLLDVGCAAGDYMALMAELGGEVSGIDIDQKEIENGKHIFAKAGLKGDFQVANAEVLPFGGETFDVVYSADMFEHISRETKRKTIAEIYRVLKPGGLVVIKTPNLQYLRLTITLRRLYRLLTLRSPFIYIKHTRNNPDNEHHGLTTYSELDELFGAHLFMESQPVSLPLRKGPLFLSAKTWFPGRSLFNEHIIVAYRKSTFLPIADRLSARVA